jgi:hypothetical protein
VREQLEQVLTAARISVRVRVSHDPVFSSLLAACSRSYCLAARCSSGVLVSLAKPSCQLCSCMLFWCVSWQRARFPCGRQRSKFLHLTASFVACLFGWFPRSALVPFHLRFVEP